MIDEVKIGDKVISMGTLRLDRIETVKRITKTKIITNESTYNSKGTLVGASSFDKPSIRTATPEELEVCRVIIRRHNIIVQIKRMDWSKVSDTALGAIRTILENPDAFDKS